MKGERIIICALLIIIFGCMVGMGSSLEDKRHNSIQCEYGRELIQNNELIGCEHIDGYISEPTYGYNSAWEDVLLIFGLIGAMFSLWGLIIVSLD